MIRSVLTAFTLKGDAKKVPIIGAIFFPKPWHSFLMVEIPEVWEYPPHWCVQHVYNVQAFPLLITSMLCQNKT